MSLPDPLDPRLRMAADLYNRGITLGLASADGALMEMRAGTYELPWGELEVAFDKNRLRWAGRDLVNFVPIAELRVDGLRVRFRRPGIGAALAAGFAPSTEDEQVRDIIAPRIKVAATAPPAKTATRFRRTNFLNRYPAPGGAATTASPERYRRMSAPSPLAVSYRRCRSFSNAFITIQSISPRINRDSFAGSVFRCAARLASDACDCVIRVLGLGGSSSRMMRRISSYAAVLNCSFVNGVVPVRSSYRSTPSE